MVELMDEGFIVHIRWTPHPAIVTIRDSRDYIRVLLYSYHATLTGLGVLLGDTTGILASGFWEVVRVKDYAEARLRIPSCW